MSAARVLNPSVLSVCKIGVSPSLSRNIPCGRQLNRIKRDLFGPANPLETNKIFNEEIEKYQETAIKKWGFDFRAGLPLQANSQYIWEPITQKESNFAPEMYTLTRAAHVRPSNEDPSGMDLLMDERSERENYLNSSYSTATDTDSCDDSQDESMVIFKEPPTLKLRSSSATPPKSSMVTRSGSIQLRKRQPRITEFMKERKRLAQTPKKLSPPAKRVRTSSGSSSTNKLIPSTTPITLNPTNARSISAHFSFRTVQNYK